MNTYGRFESDGSFRVTDPRTPEPWLHYLIRPEQEGTGTFASGITASAGGFDVRGTHENTIVDTRVHLNDRDDEGRYVYIRDAENGDLFTTSWQPVRPTGQRCETVFRFGSVRFESLFKEIETADELFVPLEFDGWVREIAVTNRSSRQRTLDIVPFLPVHMGNALVRLLAGDNDAFFGGARRDADLEGIVFRRHHGIPVADDPARINGMLGNVALFHCTLNDANTPWETNLETFLGDRFRTLANPRALLEARFSSTDTPHLRHSCGAFLHRVTLAPGETLRFAVSLILGSTENYYRGGKRELRRLVSLVREPAERARMLARVIDWWNARLARFKATLPQPETERALPWLQYQCEIVRVLNRMKSRFHTGYEYGWGFRDILQDALCLLPTDPGELKTILRRVAVQIFPDGVAYHNFFLDQEGNRSVEASDDPLWFVNAVEEYCRETGDLEFLFESLPWAGNTPVMAEEPGVLNAPTGEKPTLATPIPAIPTANPAMATIAEHCEACLSRVLADRSPRGLPWLKDCDWNDDLNESRIDGKPRMTAESVMAAEQLVATLRAWAGVLEQVATNGKSLPATNAGAMDPAALRAEADRVAETIRAAAIDSAGYFKRVLSPDGDLGASDSAEGSIFLETQIFAVNAGVVTGAEAENLLETTSARLDTKFGAMLCHPFFEGLADRNELPKKTWNIEKEPPGMKENGGIFMHLNAWLVEAWCRAGRGSNAVNLYLKTLPERLSADQDRYRCEPFVYPEYVRGAGRPGYGRGGHTWLTGTAPTMFRSLTERILGIRASWDGLIVDPCIDPSWTEFKVTRSFRGATYRITVRNPRGAEKGKATTLPLLKSGDTGDFTVEL